MARGFEARLASGSGAPRPHCVGKIAIAKALYRIATDPVESARAALHALSTFAHDRSLSARVHEAVARRGDKDLVPLHADLFNS